MKDRRCPQGVIVREVIGNFHEVIKSYIASSMNILSIIISRILNKMIFIVCFLIVFNISTNLNAAGRNIADYKKIFDQQYINNKVMLDRMAASGYGNIYYTLQYALDATLCMYQATNHKEYLEVALGWAETMVAKATIIDNQGYRNWSGDYQSPYCSIPISHMGNDVMGSIQLSRLTRIIKTNRKLNAAYGQRADVIGDFVNEFLIEKWFSPLGKGRNILGGTLRDLNELLYPGLAFSDTTARLMRILIDTYCTYLDPQILNIAVQFGNGMKQRFVPYKDALIWDLGIEPTDRYYNPFSTPTDTSHANAHIAAIIAYYKEGLVFTIDDVKGLSNLLTKVIWNGSYDSPAFTNFIDGSNGIFVPENRPPWGVGLIYSGWISLGDFVDEVQTIGDAVLTALMVGKRNPSLDSMNNVFGLMELSGHLSLNSPIPIAKNNDKRASKIQVISSDQGHTGIPSQTTIRIYSVDPQRGSSE